MNGKRMNLGGRAQLITAASHSVSSSACLPEATRSPGTDAVSTLPLLWLITAPG